MVDPLVQSVSPGIKFVERDIRSIASVAGYRYLRALSYLKVCRTSLIRRTPASPKQMERITAPIEQEARMWLTGRSYANQAIARQQFDTRATGVSR